MDYSPWFDFLGSEKSSEIRIPLERASQEEHFAANFSFVAPSSEEIYTGRLMVLCVFCIYASFTYII